MNTKIKQHKESLFIYVYFVKISLGLFAKERQDDVKSSWRMCIACNNFLCIYSTCYDQEEKFLCDFFFSFLFLFLDR